MFAKVSTVMASVRMTRAMSIWAKVPLAPPDAIFGLTAAFKVVIFVAQRTLCNRDYMYRMILQK